MLFSRLAVQAAAVIARVLGTLDRATRFDLDDRHAIPGWPTGLAAEPAAGISRSIL
jgi:hypothetical protein